MVWTSNSLKFPVATKAEITLSSGHWKISVIHTVIRRKTFENEVIKTTETSSFWEPLHNHLNWKPLEYMLANKTGKPLFSGRPVVISKLGLGSNITLLASCLDLDRAKQ